MKMEEALKAELERAVSHYNSALRKLSDVSSKATRINSEFSSVVAANSQADMDEKTSQYMRKLSGQTIEDRLLFNQSLLNAVQVNSRDKLLIHVLIEKLEVRINHDKEVG